MIKKIIFLLIVNFLLTSSSFAYKLLNSNSDVYESIFDKTLNYCYEQFEDNNYVSAFSLCSTFSNSNNSKVHEILGYLYLNGLGTSKDLDKAINYYKLAVIEGSGEAAYVLGRLYFEGKIVEKNNDLAEFYLEYSAKKNSINGKKLLVINHFSKNNFDNSLQAKKDFSQLEYYIANDSNKISDVESQYYFALFLFHGYGCNQNYEEAYKIFVKLAKDFNHLPSLFMQGFMLSKGWGTTKNYQKAKKVFLDIIQYPNNDELSKTYFYLGVLLLENIDNQNDEIQGLEYLKLSADFGFDKSLETIIDYYLEKVKKDPSCESELYSWMNKGIEQNFTQIGLLKVKYLLNKNSIEEHYQEIEILLKELQQKGVCESNSLLGDLYKTHDIQQAIHNYKQSINCGSNLSFGALSLLMFENSDYFDKDKFIEYNNKGLELKQLDAYYACGLFYSEKKYGEYYPDIALDCLKTASSNGYPLADYKLHKLYLNGKIVDQDINKSMFYLNKAAKANLEIALDKLFYIYFDGGYYKKDLIKAEDVALKSAQNNFKSGYLNLGLLNYKKNNYKEAINYFNFANRLGAFEAYIHLGKMTQYGLGVESNLFKACSLYEKGVEHNVKEADKYLALCLYELYNGEIEEVIPYLENVALKGDPEVITKLINIYSNEDSSLHNNHILYKWVFHGAKLGITDCLYRLGEMYLAGLEGVVNSDDELAIKYLLQATKQNSSTAAFRLAELYSSKNLSVEACQIYEKFRKNEDYDFEQNLALCYLNGIGKNKNIKLGEKILLENFARTSNESTAYLLGQVYSDEESPIYDITKAIDWYVEAIERGELEALNELAEIYGKDIKQKDLEKYFFYYYKSMETGNTDALLKVAEAYYDGKGVEQDFKKACDLSEEALNSSVYEASSLLAKCYLTGNGGRTKNIDKALAILHEGADSNDAKSSMMLGDIYSDGVFINSDFEFACKNYYRSVIKDENHDHISLYAAEKFMHGNVCYQDSVHAYIVFSILQRSNEHYKSRYQNEIVRLVKLLNDKEIKTAHKIISQNLDVETNLQ